MKTLIRYTALYGGACAALICGASCGKPSPEDPATVRDRVVSASRGYRQVDSEGNAGFFQNANFYTAFHSADWRVEDPFTDQTKFFSGVSVLSHTYPYKETHRALALSKLSTQQAFLMVSEDPDMERLLREKTAHWARSLVTTTPGTLISKDGVKLAYRVYHVKPGALSGDELLLELAYASKGKAWLILDAGISYGRSSDDTLYAQPHAHATLLQIVEKLELDHLL